MGELEQRALANRRAITRGHLVLHSDYSGGRVENLKVDTTVWWDGHNIRNDIKRHYSQKPPEAPSDTHTEQVVFGNEFFLWYDDQVFPKDEGKMAVIVTRRQERARGRAADVTDPRLIGMAATSAMDTRLYHLESFILPNEAVDRTVVVDKVGGVDCWKVELTTPKQAVTRFWIDPSKDYSVVQMETEWTSFMVHFLDRLDYDVVRHTPSGVWFPKSSQYRRTENDKVTEKEDLTINVVSLNDPINPSVFTLASMNLPPGTVAVQTIRGRVSNPIWNGMELVNKPEVVRRALAPPSVWTTRRIGLAISSSVCAILGALILWRYFKRLQPAS